MEKTAENLRKASWCVLCAWAQHSKRMADPDGMARMRAAAKARSAKRLSMGYTKLTEHYRFRCAAGTNGRLSVPRSCGVPGVAFARAERRHAHIVTRTAWQGYVNVEDANTWSDATEIGENGRQKIGRDNAKRLFKLE